MPSPHQIRLRGPWNLRVVSQFATQSAVPCGPVEVRVPSNWSEALGPGFRGTVEYSRHFNCPTGISDTTPLSICLEMIDGRASLSLNHRQLGTWCWPDFPKRFDITGQLLPRNELVIRIELPDESVAAIQRPPGRKSSDAGGLVGEVRLEIG